MLKHKTTQSLLFLAILLSPPVIADSKNGFVLDNALIPINEIYHGGPPKDGIPAIDKPRFILAKKADYLKPNDRILGIHRNGVTKAYPIAIMNWHEIVNDVVEGEAIAITYCPLCGSGMAFSAQNAEQPLHLGVSGLLYNSDVLLYDRESQSLWSQLLSKAVSGPRSGSKLSMIPLTHTSWADWRERHPNTLVLSTATGFNRDYSSDPYAGYQSSEAIYFPVNNLDKRYHPKEQVLGVEISGQFKAYPFAELSRTNGLIEDKIGNHKVTIEFNDAHRSARIFDSENNEIAAVVAFWFAWFAFHPDTAVFQVP